MNHKIIIVLAFLILASCSAFKISLQKRETRSKTYEKLFFFNKFRQSKSLKNFFNNHKNSNFLRKHSKIIKKYYSDYLRMNRRFKRLHSTKFGSNVHNDPLFDYIDDFWYGPFTVGTPPVQFLADFDSGSADLLLYSSNGTVINDSQVPYYNHNASSTYKKIGNPFSICYESGGCAEGFTSADTVSIAGATAKNYIFAEVPGEEVSVSMFGFGFKSLSNSGATPIAQVLLQQKQISQAIIGLYLSDDQNSPKSVLSIGSVDNSKFVGNFSYFKVLYPQYWTIAYNGFKVNGVLYPDQNTVVDSGTTLIYGDDNAVNELTNIIGNINPICNATANLEKPDIIVSIGDQDFPLKPKDYIYHNNGVDNQCQLGIQGNGGDGSILGDVFIVAYYTLYDYTNQRVGFAKSIN